MNSLTRHLSAVVVLAFFGARVHSYEAWIVISEGSRDFLVHATGSSVVKVASLGDLTLFANTDSKIGILTRDKAMQSGKLVIVDKKTAAIDESIPVLVYPASQLSGATDDLILMGDEAYFVSVRFSSDPTRIDPNALGGAFDLTIVSTKSGSVASIPLPREARNPRVFRDGSKILVAGGPNSGAWEFDIGSRTMHDAAPNPHSSQIANREADAYIAAENTPASKAAVGAIKSLPDESKVFVDSTSGMIEMLLPDGKAVDLWDISSAIPESSPSATRVIDFH